MLPYIHNDKCNTLFWRGSAALKDNFGWVDKDLGNAWCFCDDSWSQYLRLPDAHKSDFFTNLASEFMW